MGQTALSLTENTIVMLLKKDFCQQRSLEPIFLVKSWTKGDNLTAVSSSQETDRVTQREKQTVMPVVHVTRNLLGELYGGEAAVSSAHSQKIGQGRINQSI